MSNSSSISGTTLTTSRTMLWQTGRLSIAIQRRTSLVVNRGCPTPRTQLINTDGCRQGTDGAADPIKLHCS
ncbi:unnamed protein product, partial [Nesidiocoris tenuis]